MNKIYEDSQIVVYDDKLEIKMYYFPSGKSKIINFSEIKSVNELKLNYSNGKGRLWGMSLAPYWYNLDKKRFWSKEALVINLGNPINPAITPDNHQEVFNILKNKISKK